ncbi:chaperone protein DNAj [Perkinsela sp. CCAP 1560/4]|nr:chaperone protein DNAj [Perkinsela sp. CCAP 1560/4]|eukprot:KNH03627.1 chaperone protein DNAj [Perkinsela sp. CCAP 1560/4]
MEKFIRKNEDLYEILGLPKRASTENQAVTQQDITKAYRKSALDCHPDKTQKKDDIKKFHKISAAYSVLKLATSRETYDATGTFNVENQPLTSRQEDWTNLFRAMYDEVTESEVKSFYATYAGSKEEIEDLVEGYAKAKGDFTELVLSYALFDNAKKGNVTRIKRIIEKLIKNTTLCRNAKFDKTSTAANIKMLEDTLANERQLASKEASSMQNQGSKAMVQKGKDSSSITDLQVALMSNSKRMDDFVSALAAKYEDAEAKQPKRRKKSP